MLKKIILLMFAQVDDTELQNPQPSRAMEKWMLVCQRHSDLQPDISSQQGSVFTTSANPQHLQGKQLDAYNVVLQHTQSSDSQQLLMIVSGTAGTGKSYLIHCLRLLLKDMVRVAAPTGVASFNIDGYTLHSLLALPTRGDFKDLQGTSLQHMEEALSTMTYLIFPTTRKPYCKNIT